MDIGCAQNPRHGDILRVSGKDGCPSLLLNYFQRKTFIQSPKHNFHRMFVLECGFVAYPPRSIINFNRVSPKWLGHRSFPISIIALASWIFCHCVLHKNHHLTFTWGRLTIASWNGARHRNENHGTSTAPHK